MVPNKNASYEKNIVSICQYEGCGKEIKSSCVRKYCDEHSSYYLNGKEKQADKYKKYYDYTCKEDCIENIEKENLYLVHDNFRCEMVIFNCACCGSPYEVTVFPRQFIYPKFCPKHRNEYKRKIYNNC